MPNGLSSVSSPNPAKSNLPPQQKLVSEYTDSSVPVLAVTPANHRQLQEYVILFCNTAKG